MEIKIKRLRPDAVIPQYQTLGAACFDLHAPEGFYLSPGRSQTVGTGLSFEVPEGHVMLIFSRSGHGFNDDIRLANCTGVIDSDYRGEVQVKLTSDAPRGFGLVGKPFPPGSRIAQAMIIPIERIGFIEVDELGATERGANGLGSTGQ